MLKQLPNKIRKRETPFWNKVYYTAKGVRSINMPAVWPIHHMLRGERVLRLTVWGRLTSFFTMNPFLEPCAVIAVPV